MACAYLFGGNSTTQALTSGAQIGLGSAVHGFGGKCRKIIEIAGNAINLNTGGYYDVQVAATVSDNAPGNVTIQAYKDGQPIAIAQGSATIAAADDPASVGLSFGALVDKCSSSSIYFVATASAGDPIVTDIMVTVTKVG